MNEILIIPLGPTPPPPEQPDISNMGWGAAGSVGRYGFHHSAVKYNNDLYWIGGWSGSAATRSFDRYNRNTRDWTSVGQLPAATMGHVSLILDNYLYVLSGSLNTSTNNTSACNRYNFDTGQWEALPPIPTASRHGDGCVIGKKIYYFGGMTANDGTAETPTSFPSYEFDTETLTWRNLNLAISGRADVACAVYHDKIYILGGRRGGVYQQELYMYDPATGILTPKAAPPAGFGCRQAFKNYKGWLVSLFGLLTTSTYNPYCYRYHPVEDKWYTYPAQSSIMRGFGGCVVDGDLIYYFSGIRNGTGLTDSIIMRPST